MKRDKIIEFKDTNFFQWEKVVVIGAGPSITDLEKDHFSKQNFISIGVNWVGDKFDVDYNVVTHFAATMEIDKRSHYNPYLVYSRYTSDVQYQRKNYPAKGIVFDPFIDLWCGISTIIPALHLATKFNPLEIYLAGVDLKLSEDGKMYFDGYTQDKRIKPSNDHFTEWAAVVKMQVLGLSKLTGCNFLTYTP